MTRGLRFWPMLLAAAGAAVVLRLPLLTGPHLIADGDEAVLGLMAKHLAEGRGGPAFFMGQRFGLAFLEAGAAAAAMLVLGPTTLALKLGVFALWLMGGCALALAVRRLSGDTAGTLAAWLLACCPAWGAYATKALGYYTGTFLLAHLALVLTAGLAGESPPVSRGWRTPLRLVLLGGLCALVTLSQTIWLFGLAPFVLWMLHRRNRATDLAAVAAGAGMVAAAAGVAFMRQPPAHWAPPMFNNPEGLTAFVALPWRFAGAMSGAFYMREAAPSGVFPWAGALWALALPLAALRPLLGDRAMRPLSPSLVAILAVAGVSAFTLVNLFNFRYLLPAADYLIVLLALELARMLTGSGRSRALAASALLVLLLSGAAATLHMRTLALAWTVEPKVESERAALDALLAELEGRGIAHVYCLNPMLQWTVTFTSGERILARWTPPDDRDPAIPQAVDRALAQGGRVAVIGYADQLEVVLRANPSAGDPATTPELVAGRYFLLPDPDRALLERLGFKLNAVPFDAAASAGDPIR